MKYRYTHLLKLAFAAALMFGSASAFAQDQAENADAARATSTETLTYKDINADTGVPFYDPSVIDPSVGARTNEKQEAARATLNATHEAPMPGPEGIPAQQGLPGEKFLEAQVDQISELSEIKPGPALTLREALLLADEQNIDLQSAQTSLDKARAQLQEAWALLLPNVSATVSWAHLGYPTDGMASTKSTLSTLGSAMEQIPGAEALSGAMDSIAAGLPSANVQDVITVSGTVGLAIINVAGWFQLRMADAAVDVTAMGIEDGRQQLLAGVTQAYMASLLCGEVVKVQRVQLKSALDQLSLAQGRYDRGADVKLSVIQAQFAVEKQRQALIDAIWSYETSRDALANLLNISGLPVPQPTHIKATGISTNDEELENEAIEQNRTLKINRATQKINELNLNAAIADFFPTVSGFWKMDYTYSAVDMTMPGSDAVDRSWNGSFAWTLGVSVNIPLFDYSKFGVLDERKAAIRATNLSIESTQNSTRTAVRKAKREYYSALFSVDNAKRQVELAREVLQLTEAAYQNGASTFIDVSDARNNVAAASIAYITAGIQSELSLVSLISTLGRDIMLVVHE